MTRKITDVTGMRRLALPALLALVLALAVACGGDSSAEKKAAAEKEARAQASASAAAAAEKAEAARVAQQAKFDECTEQIGPLSDALAEVNSRLSVGLNYSEYGDRLGDTRVAYDKIDVDRLVGIAPKCLNAAAKLEGAYNRYTAVLNRWGKCLDDYNCDFSEGETNRKTQADWSRAGVLLDRGQSILASLEPTS